jgi:hypothetical protein
MDDDNEEKKPRLTVVSENSHLPARDEREGQRRVRYAREAAQRALTDIAACMLRTMAGSDAASYELMRRFRHLVQKQDELHELTGELMTLADEREALALASTDLKIGDTDFEYRRWQRQHALEMIVQGALRLAAHRVLDEEPHFGGKHSIELIERGIAAMNDANKPLPRLAPLAKSRPVANKRSVESWVTPATKKDQDVVPGPATQQADPTLPDNGSVKPRSSKSSPFDQNDLKELRKAIKAKDNKRITELTAKIGPPR